MTTITDQKKSGDIIVTTMMNVKENNQKNLRLVDQTIKALKAVEGISLITKPLGQDVCEIKRYLDHIDDIVKKWIV